VTQRLTQKKLGILAEVSTPTVSRFEQGEKDIQLSSVLKLLNQLGMIDDRNLTFPDPKKFYDQTRKVIVFFGEDQHQKITCAISREALVDHYYKGSKSLEAAFVKYRSRIEHEARRKYVSGRLEPDGSILIKTEDL